MGDLNTVFTPDALSFHIPPRMGARAVLFIDTANCVRFADEGVWTLLGVRREDVLGLEAEVAVRRALKHRFSDADGYERIWKRLLTHPDEVLDDVLEMAGSDGHTVHHYSTPLFDSGGQRVGRIDVYSDISQRRALEAAIKRAYTQLRAAQEQLVQTEKMRAIGEMANGVAHDFNNLLGIILGHVQLLLKEMPDDRAQSRLRAIERAALDGVDTVRRIQEFTRTAGNEQPSVVDLSAVAEQVTEMTKPAWLDSMHAKGSNIEVHLALAPGVRTLGSGSAIREALTNVVLNAIQAMPQGGRMTLTSGISGEYGWIRVEDTGQGMPEDVRRRVFEPFFTTRGLQGTGLGLSMTYGIVTRHGGDISIESKVGKGTAVTISLPRSDDSPPAPAQDEHQVEADSQTLTGPAHVLVVDDEKMFRDVLAEMISDCGHNVCVARSGPEAIERFAEESFDVVFMDLGMPEMPGWQAAGRIKELKPGTPVVLLTGWGDAMDDNAVGSSHVDMVLAKPVRIDKIRTVIAEILMRERSRVPATIEKTG